MSMIKEMFAFVAEDAGENDEDVCAFKVGTTFLPLVGAESTSLPSMRNMAQHIATTTNRPIRLVRFTHRTQLEILQPMGRR